MAKCPDLIGQKFGMLYVESKAESRKDNSSMWNCICDCSNKCVVRGRSLRYGKRTDCGCKTVLFYDLTGQRFGNLVVESKEPPNGDGKTRWRCRCDCGNTYIATSLDLRNGKKTDCGCISPYRRGNYDLIDLTGQRFGKLTVLSKEPTQKDKRTRWLCACDCGNVYIATSYALRNGKTKSCGCGRRKDITGQRFGKLTALERTNQFVMQGNSKKFLWKCVCECGETVYRLPEKLRESIHHACDKCAEQFAVSSMLEKAGFVDGSQLPKIASDKPGVHNKSGVKGVFFNTRTQKWRAVLRFQGVNHYLGEYKDINEAIKARKLGEEKYFEPFLQKHSDFFGNAKSV